MKLLKALAFAALALVSFNSFAGGNIGGMSHATMSEVDLVAAGPVDIVTQANAPQPENRRTQIVALNVTDADGNTLADATCSLTNDKGSWSAKAGASVSVYRSSEPLSISCEQSGHVIASATFSSAPTEIAVQPAPFFDERSATVPAYAPAVALQATPDVATASAF